MSTLIKPRRLNPGDRVAAVSLSWGGPGAYMHRYEAGKRQMEAEFGVQVVEMPHALRPPDWLKRNPRARADDLMAAFADHTIQAIVSTIGGEDSIRILPFVDLDVIRDHPKIFIGYSDATITHIACLKAGLGSFYGPAFMAGFAENGGMFPYMVESVRRTLFCSDPIGEIQPSRDGWTVEFLHWGEPANQERRRALNPSTGWTFLQGTGVRRGHLVGGCLEVLDWLRGSEFWPPPGVWRDAILFLETSEDAPPPAQVRYMLRTLAVLGVLKRLCGLLFGRPGGSVPVERFDEYDRAILDVVRDEEGLTDLPVITRMDFGHTDPMFVLPYGVQAEIDCETKKFSILENAVV
jgi:muramoyltetrapeptide carboxypeptidase LdcA involved in peptidoglycan recycling